MTEKLTSWALALILPLGFGGIWQLQRKIDVDHAAVEREQDQLLVESSKLMKAMSLEFAPLVADLYWTRAVQYYGSKHVLLRMPKGEKLDLLWPMLNIATTLDPQLIPAYQFGAVFLSEPAPRGAGRPDLAAQLIQRGIRENPGYWRLYYDLGMVYYFDLKDFKKASEAFYEGSKNPDSMIWMKVMAAKIASEGESLETSKFLWSDVYHTTRDEQVRQNALTHLQLIQADEDRQAIDRLSGEYEKRYGRRPAQIRELAQAGMLRGIPVDPLNYPYVLDGEGKTQLHPNSPLLEQQPVARSK